jgi:NSS family neurotransmitter:Na+ symporter
MGATMAAFVLGIVFYYGVVVGWCIRYLVYALTGVFKPGLDTEALWKAFASNGMQQSLLFALVIAICMWICSKGVAGGLEKACKVMVPAIFILLVFLAIRAAFLPGAIKGYEFYFTARMSDFLNPKTYLEAFTQVAWSTGAGWGLFLTYFVYVKKTEDIMLAATTTCFADSTAGFLAGMCVIPTIFAYAPDPMAAVKAGNTGMAFIHLTRLFAEIPGGTIMAIGFFLALVLAALSSEIAMIEMGARLLEDAGWSRKKATWGIGIVTLVLGLPSAMNMTFLDNQDWVWGVGLLVSGLLMSIGAMKVGVKKIWNEHIEPYTEMKHEWMFSAIKLFPVWFAIIFGWWTWQSITWYPGEWYKWLPISKYAFTAGTMFWQWGIVIAVSLILNNWLANKMSHSLEV